MPEPIERLLEPLTSLAAILVIAGVAVAPLLTPAWVGFEQERAQATAWTGFTAEEVRTATDALLADLVVGPPDFDVAIGGVAVLNERERAHLRDVRTIFGGFAFIVVLAALVVAFGRRVLGRAQWRASLRRGATWTVAGVVIAGLVAVVAFEPAFELFHQLFFAGGSYAFDPRTERLVQLFPNQFWVESTIAAAALMAFVGLVLRRVTRPVPA